MNQLSVFLGCGAGGLARWALTRYASAHFVSDLPVGTLAVNVLGSFLIGFLFSLFRDAAFPEPVRLLLTTGFLGGFTTFSTFALETILLLELRDLRGGILNAVAHNGLGLLAAVAGIGAYALARAALGAGTGPR